MVGVPGKSKGCNTCRKRKIAVWLCKPHTAGLPLSDGYNSVDSNDQFVFNALSLIEYVAINVTMSLFQLIQPRRPINLDLVRLMWIATGVWSLQPPVNNCWILLFRNVCFPHIGYSLGISHGLSRFSSYQWRPELSNLHHWRCLLQLWAARLKTRHLFMKAQGSTAAVYRGCRELFPVHGWHSMTRL